jgi:hypothetical protein
VKEECLVVLLVAKSIIREYLLLTICAFESFLLGKRFLLSSSATSSPICKKSFSESRLFFSPRSFFVWIGFLVYIV